MNQTFGGLISILGAHIWIRKTNEFFILRSHQMIVATNQTNTDEEVQCTSNNICLV